MVNPSVYIEAPKSMILISDPLEKESLTWKGAVSRMYTEYTIGKDWLKATGVGRKAYWITQIIKGFYLHESLIFQLGKCWE